MKQGQREITSGSGSQILGGWSPRWANQLACALITACLTGFAVAHAFAQVGPGSVPVNPPAGGFALDGDLQANTNVTAAAGNNLGDWLPGPAGSGGNVLNSAGIPLNPTTTFHIIDPFTGSDNHLQQGKLNDDPNNWMWVDGTLGTAKCDINNALIHLTKDANGHTWVAVAGDRASKNGSAYIDFEFLQNTLTVTGGASGGGFVSAGPDGGRTVNDFILTVAFDGGGSTPNFYVNRWQMAGTNGFMYVAYTPPSNSTFAAVNSTPVPVSYGAFGGNTYDVNLFAEGAVDLTALLGSFDPCLSLGVKTILIKTKTSPATSADLVDFLDPVQVSLRLGVVDAGPDQAKCSGGASTSFTLNGQATPSPGDSIVSTTWSVISGTATISSSNNLNTSAAVSSSSATLRLSVLTQNGCTATDEVVLNVTSGPAVAVATQSPLCHGGSNGTATATASGGAAPYTYLWDTTPAQTNATATGLSAGTYHVMVTDSAHCTSSATVSIMEPPTLMASSSAGAILCNGGTTTVNVSATGGTPPYSNTGPHTVSAGSYTFTVTDANGCTATTTGNVSQPATLMASSSAGAILCNGGTTTVNVSATGGTPPYSNTGSHTVSAGSYSFTVTDANGCTATTTGNVSQPAAPVINCPPDKLLLCGQSSGTNNTGSATVTNSGVGAITLTFTDAVGAINCNGQAGIDRTWKAIDACSNVTSCVQHITYAAPTNPPVIFCPTNLAVQCLSDVPAPNANSVIATVNCGTARIFHGGDVAFTNDCLITITRTYRAVDGCGNSNSCTQIISVQDTLAPVITCAPNKAVECTNEVVFNLPRAVDNCDGPVQVTVVPGLEDVVVTNSFGYPVHTRTWSAMDRCGNKSRCSQSVTLLPCPDYFCTLTQGFYGNLRGKYYGIPGLTLAGNLLGQIDPQSGQPGVVVGILGTASLTIGPGDLTCLVRRLPAGGPPDALPGGAGDLKFNGMCGTTNQNGIPVNLPLDNKSIKFRNVFLGQLITLALNTRLDKNLPFVNLTPQFCTRAAIKIGDDFVLGDKSTTASYSIPQSVISALQADTDPNTPGVQSLGVNVRGLLMLANRALAGLPTFGASLGDIHSAVGTINEAFDECRFLVVCPDQQ